MAFPQWTLWGMGLAGAAALAAIGVAYLLQSQRFIARFRFDGPSSAIWARSATGLAFAFILLAFGFFLAGVPLKSGEIGAQPESATAASSDQVPVDTEIGPDVAEEALDGTAVPPDTVASTRSTTGAFAAPPPTTDVVTSTVVTASAEQSATAPSLVLTQTPSLQNPPTTIPLPTSTATSTPTATQRPTLTPSPTLTPTPIEKETAVISTQGSTLWVRRTPGGRPLVLVNDGDVVILLTGHAHQGGIVWREVSTVAGEIGWVQEEYVDYPNEP